MKVIKVIVDEMPKSCMICRFGNDEYGCCDITNQSIWYTSVDGKLDLILESRPDWCPLVTAEQALRDCASPFANWGEG